MEPNEQATIAGSASATGGPPRSQRVGSINLLVVNSYRFDELGWFSFERMCQALLRAAHGVSVEVWGGSKSDRGRDAYASEPLRFPDSSVENEGPFVFQAKFVEGANSAGARPEPALLSAVRKERDRIRQRLADSDWEEQPSFYTLMTNVPMDGDMRESVRGVIREVLPVATIVTLGASDLAASLDAYPAIRASYPQVLGIRDLQDLIQGSVAADIRVRSSLALEEAEQLAPRFVPTAAYYSAIKTLDRHGFLVLTGPPEMGKTAIALVILAVQASIGWEPIECRNPAELFKTYQKDRSQVFVVDDAFGSTEYRPELGFKWAAELHRVLSISNRENHWIIFTSRPGPLREALRLLQLQGAARQFPEPGRIQVDASDLSELEKALMLYRHAKASTIDDLGADIVRRNARRIVGSPHFTPLRIERFIREHLPQIVAASEPERSELIDLAVKSGLEEPTPEMQKSFEGLGDDHKALLFAMLNWERGPVPLEGITAWMRDLLDRPLELPVETLAQGIEDHFIKAVKNSGSDVKHITWIHPSVRDVVVSYLMEHEQARLRFLEAATMSGLVLALSSAGGAEGRAVFPLADTNADWERIQSRVLMIARGEVDDDRITLLQVLLSALRSPDSPEKRREQIEALAVSTIEEIASVWSREDAVRKVDTLTLYFDLANRAGIHVPAPRLSSTWNERFRKAQDVLVPGIEDPHYFGEWVELVALLSLQEPRFLRAIRFADAGAKAIADFLRLVEDRIESMPELDPLEEEEVEYGVLPVEPELEEVEDREWLKAVMPILETLALDRMPDPKQADQLYSAAEPHLDTRESREDRWVALQEPDYDSHDYGHVSRGTSGSSFDLDALFADL